jgi:hypothetical protein
MEVLRISQVFATFKMTGLHATLGWTAMHWGAGFKFPSKKSAGNRQLNVALQRIAITLMRLERAASVYSARRLTMGNTKTEAIRAFRCQISDEVYRRVRPRPLRAVHRPSCCGRLT